LTDGWTKLQSERAHARARALRDRSLYLVGLPEGRGLDLGSEWFGHQGVGLRAVGAALSNSGVPTVLAGRVAPTETGDLQRALDSFEHELLVAVEQRGRTDLVLGFPMIRGQRKDGTPIAAPLFLMPHRLARQVDAAGGPTWILNVEGDSDVLRCNPLLIRVLRDELGVNIDEAELAAAGRGALLEGSFDKNWLKKRMSALGKRLGGLGLKVTVRQGADLMPLPTAGEAAGAGWTLRPSAALLRAPADVGVAWDLFDKLDAAGHAALSPAARWLLDPPASPPQILEGPDPGMRWWHLGPMDESQEEVVAAALAGRSLAVHGAPGGGRTRCAAHVVTAAVARGWRVLVLTNDRRGLAEVAANLPGVRDWALHLADPALGAADAAALGRRLRGLATVDVDDQDRQERDFLIRELAGEEGWLAEVDRAICAPGDEGVTPYDAWVWQLSVGGMALPRLAAAFPALPASALERCLDDLVRVLIDRREFRRRGTWSERRPSFAERSVDDLRHFMTTRVRDLSEVVEALDEWRDGAPAGLPSLEACKSAHAGWEKALGVMRELTNLAPAVWPWLNKLAAAQTAGSADAAIEHDSKVLEAFLDLRDQVGPEPLKGTLDELRVTAVAFDDWERLLGTWYRPFLPTWYTVVDETADALKREGIEARTPLEGAQRWRARARYTEALEQTPGLLQVLTHNIHGLNTRSRRDLQTDVQHVRTALRALRLWGAVDPVLGLERPVDGLAVKSAMDACRHALVATELSSAIEEVQSAFREWIGPDVDAWLAGGEAGAGSVEARFRQAVVDPWPRLVAVDQREHRLLEQAPLLGPAMAQLAAATLDLEPDALPDALRRACAAHWVEHALDGEGVLRGLRGGELGVRRTALASGWGRLAAANEAALRELIMERGKAAALASDAANADAWNDAAAGYAMAPLVLATPAGLPQLVGQGCMFDLVVVDGAGRMALTDVLPAASRAASIVLIGDPRAPPPSLRLATTLAPRELVGDGPDAASRWVSALASVTAPAMLRLRWRHAPHLSDLASLVDRAAGGQRLVSAPPPTDRAHAVGWVAAAGRWTAQGNDAEAMMATEVLARHLAARPDLDTRVLTTSTVQADRIRAELRRRRSIDPVFDGQMQRSEARRGDRVWVAELAEDALAAVDVLIFSVGYAPDAEGRFPSLAGELGGTMGGHLLAAGLSRARARLVTIASFEPSQVDLDDPRPGLLRLVDVLSVMRTASAGEAVPGVPVPPVSDARDALALLITDALKERGFACSMGVGHVGVRVDLALHSQTRPGQFALGVLLDGPEDPGLGGPRGRYVDRLVRLRSAGWAVVVVAVSEWVRDPAGGVEVLVDAFHQAEVGPGPALSPAVEIPWTEAVQQHRRGRLGSRALRASRGCKVSFVRLDTDESMKVELGGDAPLDGGLGLALLGAAAGETVEVRLADATLALIVREVSPPATAPRESAVPLGAP
jgi:hypothetical protein